MQSEDSSIKLICHLPFGGVSWGFVVFLLEVTDLFLFVVLKSL